MADQIITKQKLIDADKDADRLNIAVNGSKTQKVTTRGGAQYPTLSGAIQTIIDTGGFEPFATEAALLASTPTLTKKASYALDTHKIWLWENNAWKNTGLSEKDLATQALQDSIKNGVYEVGDLIELTLRQNNCINARYSIGITPTESNFKPVPIENRACYTDPILVLGGTVVRVSAPADYSIAITQAIAIGGAITHDSSWLQGEKSLILDSNTKFIGFSVRKNNDSYFDLKTLNTLDFKISFTTGKESLITNTLSKLKQKRVTERYNSMEFWNGSFNGLTGYVGNPTMSRLSRMKALPVVGGTLVKITAPTGFNIAVAEFEDIGKPYVRDSLWRSDKIELILGKSTKFIHTNVRNADDSEIALTALNNQFEIEYVKRSELIDTSYNSSQSTQKKISFSEKNQAHGGVTTFGAPFDSIDAMIHASRIGFKIAETDIVMTADNEFVCMHDTQYNNMYFTNTDGSNLTSPINVNSLTLAQAQSQFLQKSSIAKYRNPVQTVDQYFETCSRYGLKPYLEIKQMSVSQVERLANKAKKFFTPENVTFISFDQSYLNALNTLGDFKLGLLTTTSTNALIDLVKSLGENYFIGVPQNTLTPAVKQYADAKGVFVSVWTVLTNTQLNTHLSSGVQFMGTDNMPPLAGAKGVSFKHYTSGLDFSNFVLTNASVDGGVLSINARGHAEFSFMAESKNVAFLSDLIGSGNFSFEIWVAGVLRDSIVSNSISDIELKLNSLFKSAVSIGILITAITDSKIKDISFDVIEVSI